MWGGEAEARERMAVVVWSGWGASRAVCAHLWIWSHFCLRSSSAFALPQCWCVVHRLRPVAREAAVGQPGPPRILTTLAWVRTKEGAQP